MTNFATRLAALVLVACSLAACGGATQVSSAPSAPSAPASAAASTAASTTPSHAEPSEAAASSDAAPSACLDADILAALEAYMDLDVPTDPSMDEVADALAALELEGRAAGFRDDVVAAFRGETGETLDEMKLHDAMFSLIPLRSELDFVEC